MEHTDLNTLDLKESFISIIVIENVKKEMAGKRLKTKEFTNENPTKNYRDSLKCGLEATKSQRAHLQHMAVLLPLNIHFNESRLFFSDSYYFGLD